MGTFAKRATPIRADLTDGTGDDEPGGTAAEPEGGGGDRSGVRTSAAWRERSGGTGEDAGRVSAGRYPYDRKLGHGRYEKRKRALQVELLKAQRWVRDTEQKVVMLFEGRDESLVGRPDPLLVGRGRHVLAQEGSELSYAP